MSDDLYDFSDDQEKVFKEAEEKSSGGGAFKDVPDGKYQVKVMKAFMDKSAKDQRKFNWHLQILNGTNKNQYLFKSSYLDNEVGLKILKNDLSVCEVKLSSLKDLKDHLDHLLDLKLQVNKVTNKANPKFYNLFFNELLDSACDDDTDAQPDVPF